MTTDDDATHLSKLLEDLDRLEIEELDSDGQGHGADHLFVDFLLLVDEYQVVSSEVCETLKKGHLDVAKANFDNFMASSTFNSRISQFSYDERPQSALLTVSEDPTLSKWTIHQKEIQVRTQRGVAKEEATEKGAGDKKENTDKKATAKDHVTASATEIVSKVPDPITMFGIMPPHTLRTAQGHFQSAVSTLVELANIQRRLIALEKRISESGAIGAASETLPESESSEAPLEAPLEALATPPESHTVPKTT